MIEVDLTKCSRCGFCLDFCPNHVFTMGEGLATDDHSIYGAIMVGYPKHEYRKIPPRKERQIRWI